MSTVDFAWGDDTVDSHEPLPGTGSGEATALPADTESTPDANGVFVRVQHKWVGEGASRHIEKVTSVLKHATKSFVTNHSAADRRKWAPFGTAATTTDNSNVTYRALDPVPLEIPGMVTQDADMQSKIMKTLKKGQESNAFKAKFQALMGTGDEEEGGAASGGASAGGAGGYSEKAQLAIDQMKQRMGGGGFGGGADEEEGCAIRISNLSKSANQDDVRELASNFGRVARCTVPKNKFGESRGFAYVNYYSPEDAQKAIEGLDGHGYDYLILEVRLAEKRSSDPQRTSMRHVTGYGKALPQNMG